MDTGEPLVTEIPVGHAPIWAAITPDGRHVYVTNFGTSSIRSSTPPPAPSSPRSP
ncbi:hypothetical protein ACGFSD_08935 [Streptomyces caniferus]